MIKKKAFFIKSSAINIQERQTKKGKVFDVVFRIIDKETLIEKQKKLSGFKTKREAKEEYLNFINNHCEPTKQTIEELKKDKEDFKATNSVVFSLAIFVAFAIDVAFSVRSSDNCRKQHKKSTTKIFQNRTR